MFIEVHIDGKIYRRWEITDTVHIVNATWQENVDARQELTNRFVQQFRDFVMPLVETAQFYIVFESRMHDLPLEDDVHLDGTA